jgi:hypothetical protein
MLKPVFAGPQTLPFRNGSEKMAGPKVVGDLLGQNHSRCYGSMISSR